MKLIIKKGRMAVYHFPDLLRFRSEYKTGIIISESMFYTDDSCRPGWSKLWGISLGHIHWNNSYRFVYRIVDGQMKIGFYAYIGGVSPQKNHDFKGVLLEDVCENDRLDFSISFSSEGVMMRINTKNKDREVILPQPIGFTFPITKCYPNIKCPAVRDIVYNFVD